MRSCHRAGGGIRTYGPPPPGRPAVTLCCSSISSSIRDVLQNNPLYLESFLERRTEDDVLRFSYIVHCALDAIEERGMTLECSLWL